MGWLTGDKLEMGTTTASSSPTGWANDAMKNLYSMALSVANRPYAPYNGQTIAGFSPDTTAGFDMTRAGLGSWSPYLTAGADMIKGSMDPANISKWLNPFTENVINTSLGDLERARQGAINNTQAAATQAGAFGGSRHGVADALTNEAFARQAASTAAQLRSAGWDSALGQMNQGISAGVNLGQMGELMSSLGLKDAAAMLGIGGQQQQLQQQYLDDLKARWQEQRDYPLTQLEILQRSLNGAPMGQTTTQRAPTGGYTPTGLNSWLGQGSSILGAAARLPGLLDDAWSGLSGAWNTVSNWF